MPPFDTMAEQSHASEHPHVSTVEELSRLNGDDIMRGYWAGIENEPAPGSDKCASFTHGWRTGQVDGGHAVMSVAQYALWAELRAFRQVMQ